MVPEAKETTAVCYLLYTANSSTFSIAEDKEAARKLAHRLECGRRSLAYLWQKFYILPRLRFHSKAPLVRFQPRWSAKRWRSCT